MLPILEEKSVVEDYVNAGVEKSDHGMDTSETWLKELLD
jgi:hypothetical protein